MDYKMQPPTLSRKHDNLVLGYMFWVIKNSLTWQIRTRANHQSTKAIACYAKEQVTRHFRSTCMATQWPIWYIVQVKIKFNIYLLEGYTFYLALILVIMFATYVATVNAGRKKYVFSHRMLYILVIIQVGKVLRFSQVFTCGLSQIVAILSMQGEITVVWERLWSVSHL